MLRYYVYEQNPPDEGNEYGRGGRPRTKKGRKAGGKKKMAKKKKPKGRRRSSGKKKNPSKRKRARRRNAPKRRRSSSRRRSSNPRRSTSSRRRRSNAPKRGRRGRRRNPPMLRTSKYVNAAIQAGQGAIGLAASLSLPGVLARATGRQSLARGWEGIGVSLGSALVASGLTRAVLKGSAARNVLVGGLLGTFIRVVVHLWPRASQYWQLPGGRSQEPLRLPTPAMAPGRGVSDYVVTVNPETGQLIDQRMLATQAQAQGQAAPDNYLYDYVDTGVSDFDGGQDDPLGAMDYLTASVP